MTDVVIDEKAFEFYEFATESALSRLEGMIRNERLSMSELEKVYKDAVANS